MRKYTTKLYKDLVEDIDDETLQRFMQDEKSFLADIPDIKSRTVIDLGAGYGRVVPFLSGIAKSVVAIEINPDMFPELSRRASSLPNVTSIEGDFLKLDAILPKEVGQPIFLILQNSLGTIEGGDFKDTLRVVTENARKSKGQLILSLLRQPALANWGVSMYAKLKDMVGEVDKQKSNFEKGILVTNTGYTSKWWTNKDIEEFKKLGTVLREQRLPEYHFIQIDLS